MFSLVTAGENIRALTDPVLVDHGIMAEGNDAADHLFMVNNDAGSNMVKAFEDVDGDTCKGHKLALCNKAFLSQPTVNGVYKKVKGMSAHYHRSTLGCQHLYGIQESLGLPHSKPPPGNTTRQWTGAFRELRWYLINEEAVKQYDAPENCVENDDGSKFKDHKMEYDFEWDMLRQMVCMSPCILYALLHVCMEKELC